ncbi:hypothetical protein OG252_16875 [Streptomyces sp. NBC_01352]|uniref:hypothetical protein n=1 Tax=Streptomyces sp. NBC_01352 TaxID=2903834 RepID=UPI002E343F4C|nr:hypothetical protein [Streptomyces sp. NBC_01352]
MHVRFEASWCGSELGDYRACSATYADYPHDSLPPLDAERFKGTFEWLGDHTGTSAARVTRLEAVSADLDRQGLSLPLDYIAYFTSAKLPDVLGDHALTCCWNSLSGPIPSPVEPGAFLVRFFRDQQDCVLWYFYLRPGSSPFVVHSHLEYEAEYEAHASQGEFNGDSDIEDLEEQMEALQYCAPSFEEWAYRFWIENRIVEALDHDGEPALDEDQRAYLSHYRH